MIPWQVVCSFSSPRAPFHLKSVLIKTHVMILRFLVEWMGYLSDYSHVFFLLIFFIHRNSFCVATCDFLYGAIRFLVHLHLTLCTLTLINPNKNENKNETRDTQFHSHCLMRVCPPSSPHPNPSNIFPDLPSLPLDACNPLATHATARGLFASFPPSYCHPPTLGEVAF